MSEPVFKSSLTPEEIEANFKNTDFFAGVMDGLQDALSYARSKATPETIVSAQCSPPSSSPSRSSSPSMAFRSSS